MPVAAMACAAGAATADFAREDRWAQEVVPQVVVGDVVWLATPERARVLALHTMPSGPSRGAVIVVHGLGVHPDWNLIGALRTSLADRGFETLSVQMPVLPADAPSSAYRELFPAAASRLAAAVRWLKEHGATRVAIVSHSLGAAMAGAALAQPGFPAIDAWVPVGMQVAFDAPPRFPVEDVVAESDFPDARAGAIERKPTLPKDGCSGDVIVPGTDHFFGNAGGRLSDIVADFLTRVFDGRCGASGSPSPLPSSGK